MADISIREKKYLKNPLLSRRQMVVEFLHPGKANLSRKEIQEILGKVSSLTSSRCSASLMYIFLPQRHHVKDLQTIVTRGFRSSFGGGKSVGMVAIYDSIDALKKYETKAAKIRNGLQV